jgi:RNA polymerase sigma-70 factor (ECF subfamily)
MATGQLNGPLQSVQTAMFSKDAPDASDAQLLDSFIEKRDEGSFEALVRRHGPMVWAVCRRVLSHVQDTEDAFQTTFLVLVRKADSVKPRALVGNWLYGVACRTAMKARATSTKRRVKEKQVDVLPVCGAPAPEARDDALSLLDEELSRLPYIYRAAVILCDLEGKTHRAAARHLGWPVGTVSTRLVRGRRMLAKRLARRGVMVSGLALVLWARETTAAAPMPSELVTTTIRAAALTGSAPPTEGASPTEASTGSRTVNGRSAAARRFPSGAVCGLAGMFRTVLLARLSLISAILVASGIVVLGITVGSMVYKMRAVGEPANCAGVPTSSNSLRAR